jgi:hypothetical protein
MLTSDLCDQQTVISINLMSKCQFINKEVDRRVGESCRSGPECEGKHRMVILLMRNYCVLILLVRNYRMLISLARNYCMLIR